LIFTALIEANLSQTLGVISVSICFLFAVIMLNIAAPWSEILEESNKGQLEMVSGVNGAQVLT